MLRSTVTAVILVVCLAATAPAQQRAPSGSAGADPQLAERFSALALACVHQEYPNKVAHVLASDADVRPPRDLTPAFYGCYDWHSSVHGHWLLARVARLYPDRAFAAAAVEALGRSLTPEHLAAEVRYLQAPGRTAFERPYGLAWLLQLAAELREWDTPPARDWARALQPLEQVAVGRVSDWLPKLSRPIRIGEHDQTAFAFGLMLDYARIAGDREFETLLRARVESFYGADRGCPIDWEPGGQDFLSPCLAEADLMRRVLPPVSFARWLSGFLPSIPVSPGAAWLAPAVVTDPTDPKLAHLDGLNLSRAWMLDGIAGALPPDDPRGPSLRETAARHRAAGLQAVTGAHYEGGHWLGTFAVYLVTGRGLPPER